MNAYDERDKNVRALGFKDYAEYLASDLWRGIRLRAMKAHGSLCAVCRRQADQVHHRSYARIVMSGHDIGPLMPLCRADHERAEIRSDGSKATLTEANKYLDERTGKIDPFAGRPMQLVREQPRSAPIPNPKEPARVKKRKGPRCKTCRKRKCRCSGKLTSGWYRKSTIRFAHNQAELAAREQLAAIHRAHRLAQKLEGKPDA